MPCASLGAAGRAVERLVEASLAPGTWSAYSQDWERWVAWCQSVGFSDEDRELALLLYVGHCRELDWSISRISRCLAGLAFGFKLRGLKDLTKGFLVLQALKGWRRHQAVVDSRRPVSFRLLQDLGERVGVLCRSDYEVRLFRLAFALAFFGALRVGELISPSVQRPGGLRDEDVDLFGDRLEFHLRRSKTDQLGRGRRVVIFAVPESSVCPVRCLERFRAVRRVSAQGGDPLLVHEDGSYLSRFQFIAVFRKALQALGLNEKEYAGHSFRIGAATEAARLGLGDDVIKRIGRWESVRFRSYIRLG